MEKPEVLRDPRLGALKKCCQSYIDALDDPEGRTKDAEIYIFEAAMSAFYGDDVWAWINERIG